MKACGFSLNTHDKVYFNPDGITVIYLSELKLMDRNHYKSHKYEQFFTIGNYVVVNK